MNARTDGWASRQLLEALTLKADLLAGTSGRASLGVAIAGTVLAVGLALTGQTSRAPPAWR